MFITQWYNNVMDRIALGSILHSSIIYVMDRIALGFGQDSIRTVAWS